MPGPTPNVEANPVAMRQAFGDTASDECAETMLGKFLAVLRPGPFDALDEAALNAAIALIARARSAVLAPHTERAGSRWPGFVSRRPVPFHQLCSPSAC